MARKRPPKPPPKPPTGQLDHKPDHWIFARLPEDWWWGLTGKSITHSASPEIARELGLTEGAQMD